MAMKIYDPTPKKTDTYLRLIQYPDDDIIHLVICDEKGDPIWYLIDYYPEVGTFTRVGSLPSNGDPSLGGIKTFLNTGKVVVN